MNVKSFAKCQNLQINVKENLIISSWDNTEIEVHYPDELDYEQSENSLKISCKTDLNVMVPRKINLYIEKTGGNCKIYGKIVKLEISKIYGNLEIESISNSEIVKVSGNCNISNVEESLHIGKIDGNCYLKQVAGKLALEKIGGNLIISGTKFNLDCKAGGNIRIQIYDFIESHNQIIAGGNINLQLSEGKDIDLQGSGKGSYHLDIGGDHLTGKTGDFHKTIGSGQKKVIISAGGSLKISDQGNTDANDLGKLDEKAGGKSNYFNFPEILDLEKKISESINNKGSNFKEYDLENLDELEMVENMVNRNYIDQILASDTDEIKPTIQAQSASEEEKMIVLKMLQDKKITAEEADHLLQALEQSGN